MKWTSFILIAVFIGGTHAASSGANDGQDHGDVQLIASDLSGHLAMSDADRKAFVDNCVARRAELFTNFMRESSITADDKSELKSSIDETFPRFCGCLVKGLEKGLSKVQFLMAETMIGNGNFISYPGSPMPDFGPIKSAAEGLGMSSADFESARQRFRIHAATSADACFLVLWGPTLARRLHMPEYRSYSGSPETVK
jgi:hypothetical protein